jgi:hypothetical protein
MKSIMGIGLAAALLLGMGALVLPAGGARAASPTDCASIGMDFADADATKKCESGDAGDSQWRGSEQIMVVKGPGYFIYVRRLKAGYQSYVEDEDVRVFADSLVKDLFQSLSPVSGHAMVSGYNVATFSGKLAGATHPEVDCFAFTRYGGVVVGARGGFSGAPGSANGLYGGYCTERGQGVSDASILHILSELRAPVE